jgi:hypothetical protein
MCNRLFLICTVALRSERGAARIPIPADRSLDFQYFTPNPQVLAAILENMRIVVACLEAAWLPEMEAAPETAST